MPDDKGKNGICWISMAKSDGPVYCMGADCQMWNHSKRMPRCLIQAMGSMSWQLTSLVKFLIWGRGRAYSREVMPGQGNPDTGDPGPQDGGF